MTDMARIEAEDCINAIIRSIQAGVIAAAQKQAGKDSQHMRASEAEFRQTAVNCLLETITQKSRS